MKMIPLFRVSNMQAAVGFYTRILKFELVDGETPEQPVTLLSCNGAALMLTVLEGDQKPGIAALVRAKEVDRLFEEFVSRGLDTTHRIDSPVHQGPVDQIWGTREFYVTDPDGNTLRFCSA